MLLISGPNLGRRGWGWGSLLSVSLSQGVLGLKKVEDPCYRAWTPFVFIECKSNNLKFSRITFYSWEYVGCSFCLGVCVCVTHVRVRVSHVCVCVCVCVCYMSPPLRSLYLCIHTKQDAHTNTLF